MAITNTKDAALSHISSITRKYFFPLLADQVNTSNVLLMKLKKSNVSGGVDIRQPIRHARGVQENYSGTEILDTSFVDKKFAAIFDWKQKNVPVIISGLHRVQNNGAEKVIDEVRSEMEIAKEDMLDLFGTGIYSAGTDSKDIDGNGIYLSTSNTYGGISQSANSFWQAKIDSSTGTLSLAKMQERYEAAKEGAQAPNLITTTETLFNSFWGLLQPQQRFSDGDTAKAGFKNLMFNGAVVAEDSYCSSGDMIFHNLKKLKLVSSSQRKFPGKFIDFVTPHNQDVDVAHIRWAGNLVCEEPRKQAAMTALTS